MKKLTIFTLALFFILAGDISADYRWCMNFAPCDSFKLVWVFAGTTDTVVSLGEPVTHITGFDTLLNIDSLGRGLHQFLGYYFYDGADQWVSGYDDYDNTRGSAEGLCVGRVYVYDTVGNASVYNADISIYSLSGQFVQGHRSNVGGYYDFYVAQSGSYRCYVAGPPGYTFGMDTLTVDSATRIGLDTVWGYSHAVPAASPTVAYVTGYIDIGTGMVDALGNMIVRKDLTMWVTLVSPTAPRVDSSWQIVPKAYSTKPDTTTGRCTFRLPANTKITPAGTYYELSYQAYGGAPTSSGRLFKFTLDTLPDPINLLTATRVP
jgi:hypothetical protein